MQNTLINPISSSNKGRNSREKHGDGLYIFGRQIFSGIYCAESERMPKRGAKTMKKCRTCAIKFQTPLRFQTQLTNCVTRGLNEYIYMSLITRRYPSLFHTHLPLTNPRHQDTYTQYASGLWFLFRRCLFVKEFATLSPTLRVPLGIRFYHPDHCRSWEHSTPYTVGPALGLG